MGFEVYGVHPRSPEGDLFRAGLWAWPLLWGFVCEVSPQAHAQGAAAFTNSGHVVDAATAESVADAIEAHLQRVGPPEPQTVPPRAPAVVEALREAGLPAGAVPPGDYLAQTLPMFARFARASGGFCIY